MELDSHALPVRVSYVIPTRNRVSYLEKTLRNARLYVTPRDEVVIVDGGSADGTLEMVERYRDIVSTVVSGPDVSPAHAYNKGFLLARGEIIKLVTDDDHIYPEAVEKVLDIFYKHPEIDALQCGGEKYGRDPATGEKRLYGYAWLPPGIRLKDGFLNLLAPYNYVLCDLGLWFRRHILARIGLIDSTCLSADANLLAKLLFYDVDARFFSVCLYRHTENPCSVTAQRGHEYGADIVRTLMGLGKWDELLSGPFGSANVVTGTGLSCWRNWAQLTGALIHFKAQKIRWFWALLRPARTVIGRTARFVRWLKQSQKTRTLIQPIWDGSLR